MSVTLDRIIEEVRQLPPDEQRQLREMLERDSEQSRRATLSHTIRGKYAHLGVSADEFAARKAEEIALEDRHTTRRSTPPQR